jgi:hypothetical protein
MGARPMQTREHAVDGSATTGQPSSGSARRVWLLLVDPLPNRIFFDCGIVDALRAALPDRLTAVFLVHEKHVRPWRERLEGLSTIPADELLPVRVPFGERVGRRLDIELDRRVGFYPLAIRQSMRNGFHEGRWQPGHRNTFLDSDRVGPLPRWEPLDRLLTKRHFSSHRHVPNALLERMSTECAGLVVTNLQAHVSMPFLTAARRLGLPVVGYVASWDHTVGKGVVSPHLSRYVVQSAAMRDDLERYHGIEASRVAVTGWPQSDVYHRRRTDAEYAALLGKLGLDPAKPVVLYAGNTPTNQPYEGNTVERLVAWWAEGDRHQRFQLLFRPHPRDNQVRERFAAALDRPGCAVQDASYTDLGDLATLLQHVACVVANGGTVLLDGLANDRPSVCITYDEGAPPGERWADLNLGGAHYRELIRSDAMYRADDFDGLTAAIERALANPEEQSAERHRVVAEVMGEIDGHAVDRVVAAIVGGLGVAAR